MALKSPLTGDNLDYQRENTVKMISAADIAAIVTHATTVYTSQEIHEKIQKEERECACRRSRWHRDRYQHDDRGLLGSLPLSSGDDRCLWPLRTLCSRRARLWHGALLGRDLDTFSV